MGFEIKPCDPCISNKEINNKQSTICWYVDKIKILHLDNCVVSKIIEQIKSDLGKMKVVRGNQHTYVGINFDVSLKGKVMITMKDYIKECIHDIENITGMITHSKTPGKYNLFEINDNVERLDRIKANTFHKIVAKLLFVSKRVRLDIDLAISFLVL